MSKINVEKMVYKGIEHYSKNKFENALHFFKKCLNNTNNTNTDGIIYYNIGLCHYSMLNYNAAEKAFKKSFSLGYLDSGWELSTTKLHMKDITGLDNFSYRYFGKRNSFPNLPIKKIKKIEDIKIANNILVLNEQGFGDELLFSRGIKLLDNKKFSYQVYPEMIDFFRKNLNTNFFDDRSLSYEFVMSHDWWIPNGDLFKIYTREIGFDFIPFKSKEPKNMKKKVGICFKTNNLSKNSDLRSIDYDVIKNILIKYDFEYVSLQKDFEFDFATNTSIKDFTDTSNIIDELDFIITVDTVIAHLGSIKGKKTYVIWDEYLDWRWKFKFYKNSTEVVNIKDLEEIIKKEIQT